MKKKVKCKACKGTGKSKLAFRLFGIVLWHFRCSECKGSGHKTITQPQCLVCKCFLKQGQLYCETHKPASLKACESLAGFGTSLAGFGGVKVELTAKPVTFADDMPQLISDLEKCDVCNKPVVNARSKHETEHHFCLEHIDGCENCLSIYRQEFNIASERCQTCIQEMKRDLKPPDACEMKKTKACDSCSLYLMHTCEHVRF